MYISVWVYCLFVCLFVYLFVYSFVRSFVRLSVCLLVRLFVSLFIWLVGWSDGHLFICLCVCLPMLTSKDIKYSAAEQYLHMKKRTHRKCHCNLKPMQTAQARPVARGRRGGGVRRTTPNLPKGPLLATKWAKNFFFFSCKRVGGGEVQKVHLLG